MPATIDVHAHVLSQRLVELTAGHQGLPNPHNAELMRTRYRAAFESVDVRLETMARQGIDLQVLSHMPNFGYWADQLVAEQIVDAANTLIADMCRDHPRSFVGLGLVSLQFPELAARQLSDAMQSMGMRGVEIGTRLEDRELDAAELEPFWAAAESLGAVVFMHPAGTTLGRRVEQYYLSNVIGNPLDTTIALSHLVFGGVLERHPRLKLVAAHGGGYLPSYMPRSDHGYAVRPEARTIAHPPSYYVRRMHVDSLVYEPANLAHIVRQLGASQVVLGTDYPFDMGEEDPLGVLASVDGLSEAELDEIRCGNALQLLGLTA